MINFLFENTELSTEAEGKNFCCIKHNRTSSICTFCPDVWNDGDLKNINSGASEPAWWIQGEKSQGSCRSAEAIKGEKHWGRKITPDEHKNARWGNDA